MTSGRRRAALPFCLVPLLATGGCGGFQSPLAPAGEQAASIHSLFWLMMAVCGFMYVLVLAGLGVAVVRAWRRRGASPGEPSITPPDEGLNRGLLAWAGLIVVGLTVLIVGSFWVERTIASARARDALEVRVTGHQWWWRIQYRDPATGGWIETANELHLPLGRTTRVSLGASDVIHSFWIPNVAQKLDLIPGRINTIDLTPTRAGWFRGQCAEFCGVQHAHMALDVKIDTAQEFNSWLASQARPAARPADPAASRGFQLVTEGQCAMCHAIRGTPARGRAGPDLTHFGARRSVAAGTLTMSRGAIQGWITQPQAVKPGTMMPPVALSPADADAASRYLMGLK
ncbi:c-type cytochrome [Sphingomonas sp. IC-11]|uniref:cytochrome c oxidase subunit II n=1 Tax=Sphingomonas sp. IC-11 TaxID=2898528 RepID=UPI001E2ABEFD|nr:c-type cytochrome [Sphingomonas sp. IC-11]